MTNPVRKPFVRWLSPTLLLLAACGGAPAIPDPDPPTSHTLTVSVNGSGTVSGQGISCGADCTETYPEGTQVTLTAAAAGSSFAGWSGCDSTTDNRCTVAMTGDRTVAATFTASPTDQCLPSATANPGDDLAQIVADACEGATLTLAAGEHTLAATLELDKALTLAGVGSDSTRIVTTDGNRAIEYSGTGELSLHDLTFEYRGENRPILVRITSGSASVSSARFTNGFAGLVFIAEATGTVEGSRFDGNAFGIAFQGRSEVTARDNVVEGNANGINVEEQARPVIEDNTVRNNTRDGITFVGSAAGTARGNVVESNLQDGVPVADEAQPLLENNTVRNNLRMGIAYFGSAAGTARGNVCSGNVRFQMFIRDDADPVLEDNDGCPVTRQ